MPRNSSTSSFKKWPLAFLLTLVLVGITEALVGFGAERNWFKVPSFIKEHRQDLQELKEKEFGDESIIVLGNSRAGGVSVNIVSNMIYGRNSNRITAG